VQNSVHFSVTPGTTATANFADSLPQMQLY